MKRPYYFDPHTHTSESSFCAKQSASDLVHHYHARGFGGIAITDHLNEYFFNALDYREDWNACMNRFLEGYRAALAAAESLDLDIVLGVEIESRCQCELLLYGFDEEFLYRHPYFYRLDPPTIFERFKDELLIIQAHPYRYSGSPVYPDAVHGMEVLNTHPRHQNHNNLTKRMLKHYPHLLPTCGSDVHRSGDEGGCAMEFDERINDSFAYRDKVKAGAYQIVDLR